MPDFHRARVALLEARLAEEAAEMVRRLGGEAVSAPAVREVAHVIPHLADDFVVRLASAPDPIVVCLTGAGVRALFAQAMDQGCQQALTRALARATTVCRGPKPAGALASHRLPVSLRARDPFTTREVVAAMEPLRLGGRFVAVLHYGEHNATLTGWLRERGADVCELLPYEWRLPDDTAPLVRLIAQVLEGRVDAVAFTSQVQVRHLWEVAGAGQGSVLARALNRRAVVGAIGPTCAAALEAAGVPPTVVASPPKLNVLLLALADAVERAGPRP